MATRLRLVTALCALVTAVIVTLQAAPPGGVTQGGVTQGDAVQLRYTAAPLEPTTTIKSPVIAFTNPSPFDPCRDIPLNVIEGLGLAFTPPEPEEGLRCHYDSANYQMAIEPIVWRKYEEALPPDAVELTINGHRAGQFWVMKPTDWNDRWWFSCMITFKTSYGVIQQSLFYSPIYSYPDVDCLAENLMRAQQLSPHYIF